MIKKECYSHSFSIDRQDNSLWQSFDRCSAGTNQQHTTMIDAAVEVQWYPVRTKGDHKI
jgi:hypothetical protein